MGIQKLEWLCASSHYVDPRSAGFHRHRSYRSACAESSENPHYTNAELSSKPRSPRPGKRSLSGGFAVAAFSACIHYTREDAFPTVIATIDVRTSLQMK